MNDPEDGYVPGMVLASATKQTEKLSHDPGGMYVVVALGEYRYDVVQTSSGVIVASAALNDTADAAAAALNACAVVPKMIKLGNNGTKPAIENDNGYFPPGKETDLPTYTLSVEAVLDSNNPTSRDIETHMRQICNNPYVRSVSLERRD